MQSNLSRIILIVRFVHNPIIGAFEANRGWVPKMWVLFLAAYTPEGKVGSYIVSNQRKILEKPITHTHQIAFILHLVVGDLAVEDVEHSKTTNKLLLCLKPCVTRSVKQQYSKIQGRSQGGAGVPVTPPFARLF